MAADERDRALAALARERGDALVRYAFMYTGDTAAAQDLVQDAMVKVFVRMRGGFEPDLLEAYVRRTVTTLFIDGHRRRRQWGEVRHLFTPDPAAPTGPDRGEVLDLHAALATLPPQERAAVVLRYFDDLTVPDVADRMGLATGTVKRYLSNAVAKLEQRLGPLTGAADEADHAPVLPHGRRD